MDVILFLFIYFLSSQQVDGVFILKINDTGNNEELALPCTDSSEIRELGEECKLLKTYNQSEVLVMGEEETFRVGELCACQLSGMHQLWLDSYDGEDTRRLSDLVTNVLEYRRENQQEQPNYFWNDIDVILYKVSVYTSTRDYFEKSRSTRLSASIRQDAIWQSIKRFCRKISTDDARLYRYMENLSRINPGVFLRLTAESEIVDHVYQASKSCKLLLLLRLRDYKLRPDRTDFIPVDISNTLEIQTSLDESDSQLNDLETMLRSSSALLLNCRRLQESRISLQQLARYCPMMIGNQLPSDWIELHPTPLERSQVSVNCGCQLLWHNTTWKNLMDDPNVIMMSKAMALYMNENRIPDFSKTPIWSIYGWFNDIMAKFSKNRKMFVKQVVKIMTNTNQDHRVAMTRSFDDKALEIIRRGCNYVVFNYNKGAPKQVTELKLVKYLDNLLFTSQDPMFVFHLTLQDVNLFKIYALSKMCQPVVR